MPESQKPRPKRGRRKSAVTLPVVRDATFARATIDKSVVLPLGRDVEISCLQFGPLINAIHDHGVAEEVKLSPTYSEVARLRFQWPEVTNMAMQILQAGVDGGHLNVEKIAEIFMKMSAEEKVSDGQEPASVI